MNTTELKARIREITNTTANDYSEASLIRDLNSEFSMIQINILRDRGVLEFDDTNFSDIPVAVFPTNGNIYKLTEDEDGNKIITIHKVAISVDGKEHDIPRLLIGERSQDALLNTTTKDIPDGYYEIGNSIVLSHTPNGGTMKIWFDREMSFLTTSDTTKVPGIPSAYHNLACYRAALNYDNLSDTRIATCMRKIQMYEAQLEQFEHNRRDDENTVLTVESVTGL